MEDRRIVPHSRTTSFRYPGLNCWRELRTVLIVDDENAIAIANGIEDDELARRIAVSSSGTCPARVDGEPAKQTTHGPSSRGVCWDVVNGESG